MVSSRSPLLIYTSLVASASNPQNVYMHGVTAVKDPSWLWNYGSHFCTTSKPSSVEYRAHEDQVMATVIPYFGISAFPLPPIRILCTEMRRFHIFGRAILDGKVFERLKPWSSQLISSSITMVNGMNQKRALAMFRALSTRKIASKSELTAAWSTDAHFLLGEYLLWLPSNLHAEVALQWPPTKLDL